LEKSMSNTGNTITPPTGERKVYSTDPGHEYHLADGQRLRFIKKVKNETSGSFDTVWVGTTNEELLEVLIDRTTNLNDKLPSAENIVAIDHMKKALAIFEARTAARKRQGVEATPLQHQPDQSVIDAIQEPKSSVIMPSLLAAGAGLAAGAVAASMLNEPPSVTGLREAIADEKADPPRAAWPFPGDQPSSVDTAEDDDAGDDFDEV
jgi:hypothetical protein